MLGRLRRMVSGWSSDYFLFPKLKEHLSGTRFSSDSDVKTAAENWLNGQGRDFYQAWLNKLALRPDKCLNNDCFNIPKQALLDDFTPETGVRQ
ncbi:hypothetical protein AVEN_199338-1 [Araneus ventricosus]|uniref:Uncharacterized protein n=1 Tax=Araneus ventricosus TaxID=182803 RepID=A0A4Y2JE59_ARAVE|nr:hypothetical protein AVEN_199338-1 [Araneus ventricosus]